METVVASAEPSSTTTPRNNKAYQAEMTLTSSPRELTPHEADTALAQTMHQWALTHPEAEVKYVEIEKSSPQVLRFQFIAHEQSPIAVVAAIAAALAAIFAWVAAHALAIIITFAVAAVCLFLIRLPDYFLSPTVYECPYCGKQFKTYEALVAHIKAEHPDKPIPPKPTGVSDVLKWVVIGVVAIVGVSLAYRYGIRPLLAKKPKEEAKVK